jgi:hypothetical protein
MAILLAIIEGIFDLLTFGTESFHNMDAMVNGKMTSNVWSKLCFAVLEVLMRGGSVGVSN